MRFTQLFLLLCFIATPSFAVSTVGVYGVNHEVPQLGEYEIETLQLSPDRARIAAQVALGRKVWLTLNVYGGSSGWQQFPDAVPVLADGSLMPAQYGGICPSHEGWRSSRLDLLRRWMEQYGGDREHPGIAGIWLDFIRFPGHWEEAEPKLFDLCWCDRCLSRFQQESGVKLPAELQKEGVPTSLKSAWIKANALPQWQAWRQRLITNFVHEAAAIVHGRERPVKLGLFLVPWRQSDFGGAVISRLGQNAAALAREVDVLAPMVYHRMCDRPVAWIEEITRYFKEIATAGGAQLWPIIQTEETMPQEFAEAVRAAEKGGADGLQVYTLRTMQPWQWPIVAGFTPQGTLLGPLQQGSGKVVATAALGQCEPGAQYLFAADFLRPNRSEASAYPEVELWGKEYRLNSHRLAGTWQRVKALVSCPAEDAGQGGFRLLNRSHTPISMRNASVTPWRQPQRVAVAPLPFYPLASYGGTVENLAEMKKLGLNSAVLPLKKEAVAKCLELEIRCAFGVPHDPIRLQQLLAETEPLLKQGKFLFYVNDEPALHGVSSWQPEDVQRIVKGHFPDAPTMMAVVRPQTVPFYAEGADYFMLDQYPVPTMPMTWLPDSIDTAARLTAPNRVMAVIQAFGGGVHTVSGWPRLPTFAEMYDLAALAAIHNSRGLWFFTWDQITRTPEGRKDFAAVVQRLQRLSPWLQAESQPVTVEMLSPYSLDAAGKAAVHCTVKEADGQRLLLCANSLRYSVRGEVSMEGRWKELFSGEELQADGGRLELSFPAFGVKALVEQVPPASAAAGE